MQLIAKYWPEILTLSAPCCSKLMMGLNLGLVIIRLVIIRLVIIRLVIIRMELGLLKLRLRLKLFRLRLRLRLRIIKLN